MSRAFFNSSTRDMRTPTISRQKALHWKHERVRKLRSQHHPKERAGPLLLHSMPSSRTQTDHPRRTNPTHRVGSRRRKTAHHHRRPSGIQHRLCNLGHIRRGESISGWRRIRDHARRRDRMLRPRPRIRRRSPRPRSTHPRAHHLRRKIHVRNRRSHIRAGRRMRWHQEMAREARALHPRTLHPHDRRPPPPVTLSAPRGDPSASPSRPQQQSLWGRFAPQPMASDRPEATLTRSVCEKALYLWGGLAWGGRVV